MTHNETTTRQSLAAPWLQVRLGYVSTSDHYKPLMIFRFAAQELNTDPNRPVFHIHLQTIGEQTADEIWETSQPVSVETKENILCSYTDNLLALHMSVAVDSDSDIAETTYAMYSRLFTEASNRGFSDVVRTWNYLPDLNVGEGDKECYKQFSVGRWRAAEEHNYDLDALPAGTAIGSVAGTPITVSILCSKYQNTRIENPRQRSAFEYPRQYGVRSPLFARSVKIGSSEQNLLLVSGTASIIGHNSIHHDIPQEQAHETIQNIRLLLEATSGIAGAREAPPLGCLRIYIRRAEDYDTILTAVKPFLNEHNSFTVLLGDICRDDLLVEIEAVYQITSISGSQGKPVHKVQDS
jgi:chorismate lyase/3-hydroxybenzoate synthase